MQHFQVGKIIARLDSNETLETIANDFGVSIATVSRLKSGKHSIFKIKEIIMPSKAKVKGNSAELELCKLFKGIFGGSFIRVPNSGAYIGGKNAFRREFLSEGQVRHAKGDIIPPGFMPKFVIESKFYADFAFHSLMTPGNVPQLDKWIEQTLDCVEAGDVWYVAFKINRRGWFVAFPKEMAVHYEYGNHCSYSNDKGSYVVTELTEFFTKNKDTILALTK